MKHLLTEKLDGTELYYRGDSHDLSMIHEIWKENCYARHFPFGRAAVVVDVGAHNGYFSIFSARHTDGGSRIYSFEPVEENYDIMIMNVEANGISNIRAENVAVSDRDGFLEMHINPAHTGGHSVLRDRVDVYRPDQIVVRNVPCVAFRNSIPSDVRRIDFCKIDCEGAEFQILSNSPVDALMRVSVFAVEFHEFGGHVVEELVRLFEDIGYKVEYSFSPSNRGIRFGMLWAVRPEAGGERHGH